MSGTWGPDVLGPDFQALTLDLGEDDEGELVATLVRHRPAPTVPDAAASPAAAPSSDPGLPTRPAPDATTASWPDPGAPTHEAGPGDVGPTIDRPTPDAAAALTPPTPPDPGDSPYEARPGDVGHVIDRTAPHPGDPTPAHAVLYLHGWNDYFFQVPTAEFWRGLGVRFYAVDLRKYGRSLRPGQTPGYIEDLADYDREIGLALAQIRADLGPHTRVMLHGHSTGGLVAALWADRHPGGSRGLVLNSPWLELAGAAFARALAVPLSTALTRSQPKGELPNIDPGHNARAVLKRLGGEWEYDEAWRPSPMFPIRPGWAQAILAGHARVAQGLNVREPVLTLVSAHSLIVPRWRDELTQVDSVLDVELIARRSTHLGPVTTLVRIAGGQHDLSLSALPARTAYFREIARWTSAYGWSTID